MDLDQPPRDAGRHAADEGGAPDVVALDRGDDRALHPAPAPAFRILVDRQLVGVVGIGDALLGRQAAGNRQAGPVVGEPEVDRFLPAEPVERLELAVEPPIEAVGIGLVGLQPQPLPHRLDHQGASGAARPADEGAGQPQGHPGMRGAEAGRLGEQAQAGTERRSTAGSGGAMGGGPQLGGELPVGGRRGRGRRRIGLDRQAAPVRRRRARAGQADRHHRHAGARQQVALAADAGIVGDRRDAEDADPRAPVGARLQVARGWHRLPRSPAEGLDRRELCMIGLGGASGSGRLAPGRRSVACRSAGGKGADCPPS
jgi:hypothetical protein